MLNAAPTRILMARILMGFVMMCIAWVSLASPARAQTGPLMTGKALALLCSSKKESDIFACQTYIAGVVDYHHLIKGLGTAPSVNFCLPKGVTMGQIQSLVTRYIVQRTEHHDFIAAPAVALAIYSVYPCKSSRRR